MRFCCFDLETTGLDVLSDRIIEIGWAVYDTEKKAPLIMAGHIVSQPVRLTDEIVEITGITNEMVAEFGRLDIACYKELEDILDATKCAFMVGHNALGFDGPMLSANMVRADMDPIALPILDTKIDLPLEYKPRSTSLNYMLADHGRLNPFPHRALFDALSCGMLLQEYDVHKIVDTINYPLVEIRAVVSYDDRHLASKLGYYWNAAKKIWAKTVRECHLTREKALAEGKFQVVLCK